MSDETAKIEHIVVDLDEITVPEPAGQPAMTSVPADRALALDLLEIGLSTSRASTIASHLISRGWKQ